MTESDKEVMQQALDALNSGDFLERTAAVRVLEAAIAQPVQPVSDEWKEAVLDEVIVAGIYTADHDNNPRKAVKDAILWNCQVALDPRVSSDAQALIDYGKAQLVQPAPPECETEGEKRAYAFGWFKALEQARNEKTAQPAQPKETK